MQAAAKLEHRPGKRGDHSSMGRVERISHVVKHTRFELTDVEG